AVINAVRHAQPGNIEIHLNSSGNEVLLCVSDDGRGMQPMPQLYARQWHPRQRAHPARQPERRMTAASVAALNGSSRIRVILADDHPVVRDGLANIVNQQKDMLVVAEADDGDAAIVAYEQHRPDVMVLDLRMPRRDGVAVVETGLG